MELERCPFAERQVDLLRGYLNEAHRHFNKLKKTGWDQIASLITDHCVELSDTELETMYQLGVDDIALFGESFDHNGQLTMVDRLSGKKRRQGNNLAKFASNTHGTLKPYSKLVALYLWLSSEDTDNGVTFDFRDFYLCKFNTSQALSSFLNDSTDEEPLLTDKKLIGRYSSNCGSITIAFRPSNDKDVYFAQYCYTVDSIAEKPYQAECWGWLMVLSGENLICIYGDLDLNANGSMFSIFLNQECLVTEALPKLSGMALMVAPDTLTEDNSTKQCSALVNNWGEKNLDNVVYFQRVT